MDTTPIETAETAENSIQTDRPAAATPRRRRWGWWVTLLMLALVAVGGVVYLKAQVQPVERRGRAALGKMELVRVLAEQANRRNCDAERQCEHDLTRVFDRFERLRPGAAQAFAAEVSGYGDSATLVGHLAYDTVTGKNTARARLEQQLLPQLNPFTGELAREANRIVQSFERKLQASTLQFAQELAGPGVAAVGSEPLDGAPFTTDLSRSLRNLGFNAAGVGVAIAFDGYVIWKTRLIPRLLEKLAALAGRRFAGAVASASASAAIAAADGPFLLGDAIAVAGAAWTLYDLQDSRKSFEKDLATALENHLEAAQTDLDRGARQQIEQLMKHYRTLQGRLEVAAVER